MSDGSAPRIEAPTIEAARPTPLEDLVGRLEKYIGLDQLVPTQPRANDGVDVPTVADVEQAVALASR